MSLSSICAVKKQRAAVSRFFRKNPRRNPECESSDTESDANGTVKKVHSKEKMQAEVF